VTGPDHSDGVFTTLLARGGVPLRLEAHVARIAASIRALYGVAVDEAALAERVARTASLTAGLARVRIDYRPAGEPAWTVTTTALDERPREPWRLVVRRVDGGWGPHKWRDRALLEAWADPTDPALDPLLVDVDDLVLETGRGNVFAVVDGVVVTPPLDGRILPGTTRAVVLGLLAELGIAAEERALTLVELRTADEMFVTNAVGGVRPVSACDEVRWPTGPVTRAADAALEDTLDEGSTRADA
jgi:para-aminobenzoate synthetase/4-amino-4-deoxychorismate lyase